jgi:hypothetical protein
VNIKQGDYVMTPTGDIQIVHYVLDGRAFVEEADEHHYQGWAIDEVRYFDPATMDETVAAKMRHEMLKG